MTKWIIVSLVLLLAVGTCFGQTAPQSWYFAGPRIDYAPERTTKIMGGLALDLGKGFLVIPQVDIGAFDSLARTSSLTGDIGKRLFTTKYGSLYAIFAGSLDYVNFPEKEWTAYLNGAVGGFYVFPFSAWFLNKGPILTYVHDNMSLYGGIRYKTDLKEATAFPDGWQFGAGLVLKK